MSTRYNETILTEAVLRHGVEILPKCLADISSIEKYLERCYLENLDYPIPKTDVDKNYWHIPEKYKNMDIEQYLFDICPKENHERLALELSMFRSNGMIPVLQSMKYLVDILRNHKIVWGVGRGSSVASYVLFLLGVHKIDSVKYKLPIEEFFKGEQNG